MSASIAPPTSSPYVAVVGLAGSGLGGRSGTGGYTATTSTPVKPSVATSPASTSVGGGSGSGFQQLSSAVQAVLVQFQAGAGGSQGGSPGGSGQASGRPAASIASAPAASVTSSATQPVASTAVGGGVPVGGTLLNMLHSFDHARARGVSPTVGTGTEAGTPDPAPAAANSGGSYQVGAAVDASRGGTSAGALQRAAQAYAASDTQAVIQTGLTTLV